MGTATRTLTERILATRTAGARPAALARLRSEGLPDGRDENWRHANLRPLGAVADFGSAAAIDVPSSLLPAPTAGHARLLCVNGQLVGSSTPLPPGLELLGEPAPPTGSADSQRYALLNELFAPQPLRLRARRDGAVEILHVATANGGCSYPTLSVEVAPDTNLRVVERHVGTPGARGLVSAVLRLELARGAQLRLERLQQLEEDALFLDQLELTLADHSNAQVCNVATGGASTRLGAHVRLAGRGAALQWHGLAVGHASQVHDALLRLEHLGTDTRTQQVFRALATDRARVCCNGDLVVAASARGANLAQSLRGLIDGVGAEIDLRPRLEIHIDEVQASHGATTGQLDENLLFYLLSRGLDRDTARALLKWAFLGDVLGALATPELRRAAEHAAAGHLSDVLATGALQ